MGSHVHLKEQIEKKIITIKADLQQNISKSRVLKDCGNVSNFQKPNKSGGKIDYPKSIEGCELRVTSKAMINAQKWVLDVINEGEKNDLVKLHGIGEKRAQKIIQERGWQKFDKVR